MNHRIPRTWTVTVFVSLLAVVNLVWFDTSPSDGFVDFFDPAASTVTQVNHSSSPETLRSNWVSAILRSTEIIYRDSSSDVREYWLSQPPPTIYIYDNIPPDFSDVATISSCVDKTFLGQDFTETWVEKHNCLWRPQVCEDSMLPSKPRERKFFAYRQNYNMDVAYLERFYRYPYQTTDPSKADIFVVPYPHKSHCVCHQDFQRRSATCAVPFVEMKANVLDRLNVMKNATVTNAKQRHLFFHGADWYQENPKFRGATATSMSLSLGPVWPCKLEGPCGHVTLPYISTDLDYQPFMATNPLEETLWSSFSERIYFLSAALGPSRALKLRSQFLNGWKDWIGDSIGGKANHVLNLGVKRKGKTSRVFKDLYRNSTVCLVVGLSRAFVARRPYASHPSCCDDFS
jgi:ribosome modulation factor